MKTVRRSSTILCVFLTTLAGYSRAQTRGIGAGALVLDDYNGHTVTITIPTMTGPGPYFWTLPITAGGVPIVLPTGSTPNSTLYWNGSAWTANTNFLAASSGALTATSITGLTTPLSIGQGGTGTAAAPTPGGVIYGASSTALASGAAGTSGQVLTSNGASPPSWTYGLPSGAIVAFPNDNNEAGFTDWSFSQTFGTNAWTTGATLPVGQFAMTSAVVGGKIYVIGGGNGSLNNNQIYDPVANSWTTGAVLPVGQSYMTSAVVGGKIYVIGGFNGSGNNNQIYDPVANSWTTGAPLPIAQFDMTSAVVGGKIYVIGGILGSENNNQIYDPVANSWTTGTALPVGQDAMTSAVVGGKIYVIGGILGSENNNQIYDPVANSWTTGAPLPVAQFYMTSAVVGGKIYVIGGNNGSGNNNQIYDPVANSWTTGTALPVAQALMTSAVVGGQIYVIGGEDGSYNNNQIYSPGLTVYYFQKN